MLLWVVGKFKDTEPWEFQGVFDSEAKAVRACKSPAYFVGPVQLNYTVPDETDAWPGMYYPVQAKPE